MHVLIWMDALYLTTFGLLNKNTCRHVPRMPVRKSGPVCKLTARKLITHILPGFILSPGSAPRASADLPFFTGTRLLA